MAVFSLSLMVYRHILRYRYIDTFENQLSFNKQKFSQMEASVTKLFSYIKPGFVSCASSHVAPRHGEVCKLLLDEAL